MIVPAWIAACFACSSAGKPRLLTSESPARLVSAPVCSGALLASGSVGGFDLQAASAKPLSNTISIICATRIHLSYRHQNEGPENEGSDRKNRAKFCHKALSRAGQP